MHIVFTHSTTEQQAQPNDQLYKTKQHLHNISNKNKASLYKKKQYYGTHWQKLTQSSLLL